MTDEMLNKLPLDNNDDNKIVTFHDTDNMYEADEKNDSSEEKPGTLLTKVIPSPLWLSISEAAKIGGVQNKTVRRAIQSKSIKYKITGNRYSVDLTSLIKYLHTKTKLKNKFNQYGIGQYVKEWLE